MASPTVANAASAVNIDGGVKILKDIAFASSGSTQCIVVFVAIRSQDSTVASVTDDASNTYTKKTSVLASEEVDYALGGVSKGAFNRNYVQGEIWTAFASTGTVSKVTVTLTDHARFAVIIQGYSGSAFGASGNAAVSGTSAPSITVTTQTNGSWLVGGFASANILTETVSAGSKDNAASGSSGENNSIALTTAHLLKATAGATTITLATSDSKTVSGATFAIPATFAVCAVEVKG